VQAFRDDGVLPDAMVNYLARLGWSHGDREVFTRAELVELFDIKDVAASGAIFDRTKLEWLSQQVMKQMPGIELAALAEPFVRRAGLSVPGDRAWLGRVADTLKERAKTLVELVEAGRFYFERPAIYDAQAAQKLLTPEGGDRIDGLVRALEGHADFTPAGLERLYRERAAAHELKLVDLAQLTRLALTGRTASPPIFEVMALLGRDETRARLRAARMAIGSGLRP
jgi:glutamyl-tRNA synthetase